jgi:hypothetical protein
VSSSSTELAKQVAAGDCFAICVPEGSPGGERESSDMDKVIERLILDLIDWLVERERTYDQVTYQVRNSHVRLHVWEEANRLGLIRTEILNEHCVVKPTSLGLVLAELRRENRRHVRHSRSGTNVQVRLNVLTTPSQPVPRRERQALAVSCHLDGTAAYNGDDPLLFSDTSQITRRSDLHHSQPASANSESAKCAACGG